MSAIINALRKALDSNASDWENRYALIDACVSADQMDTAIEVINEVEVLPEDESSLIAAGLSYAKVGAAEDGLGIIQSVLQANPENADAKAALAEISEVHGVALPTIAVVKEAEEEVPIAVAIVQDETPVAKAAPASVITTDDEVLEIAAPVALQAPTPTGATPAGGAQTVSLIDVTVSLIDVDTATPKPSLDELAAQAKPVAPNPAAAPKKEAAEAPVLAVGSEKEVPYDPELEDEAAFIAESKKASALTRLRTMQRDKVISLAMTILIHLAILGPLALVISLPPRDAPPSIVATSVANKEEEVIDNVNVERTKITNQTAAATVTNVVSAAGVSNFSVPNISVQGDISVPAQDVAFAPSMAFAPAMTSTESVMMFGEPIEGEVLGVILDVSGSMAEFLPMVVREVDKNYKNAPIVYINNALMMGKAEATRIYPIVEKEVMPHWPKEWEKGNSPYWFLWNDLPRKAPQRAVDRLIETFKKRPNSFIARGGSNRISSAADFLVDQKCDSLYIFSDFEDFVDEELAASLGQRLGRSKIKTYVQPASEESDHLATIHNKVARRTLGRKLPPLSDILRPKDDTPEPLMVKVDKPTPVPEGVTLATRRPTRDIDKDYWSHTKTFFKDELKVFEYENFDIALHGPEARAYIYLKDKEGFLQRPVIFGYHSAKYTMGTDNRLHWRRRKFIKHIEEPKLDGNEFTWNMMLEDDLEFKVIFWFKEDTATGTYVAEKPAEGERDDAHIYFIIPPLAREKNDRYFAPDYPADGLKLDEVRVAVSDNRAIFHLPGAAGDTYDAAWERLGFKRGHNVTPYNVLYRTLPNGVREVTVQGPSFAKLQLHARTTSNKLLLRARGFRADMELWEGFICQLVRPGDERDRFTKTEAIEFSVSRDDSF
ncbi:hypothetical protein N8813_02195 [bacterium]|nr:hypothetical protein [bacterium]MDC0311870.1 hypothetical protein [bacterium]